MIRKCILRCKNGTHNPITLPHNKNVIIGRSRETQIKDKRCSKNQIELLANCEACSVTVRQIGANNTSINGKALKFGNTAHLEHKDAIEILSGSYFHIIEFDPPPPGKLNIHSEITECKITQDVKNIKKRKADIDEEAPPKKMERSEDGKKIPAGIKCKEGWSTAGEGQLLIYNSDSVESRNKIAGYDMDGTLITTKSGKVFPVDYDDWQILYPEVPGKLKKLWREGYKIVIFTNQAGISRGKQTVAGIQKKIQFIIEKLGVPIQAFVSTGKGVYRKPMLGMWNYLKDQCNEGVELSQSDCLYVGDAAGRTENVKRKDHSCADRLYAINIGIKFYTPEEHFQGVKQQKFNMPEFDPHKVDENYDLFEPSTAKVPQYPQEKGMDHSSLQSTRSLSSVVMDLECTGVLRNRHEIVQISALDLSSDTSDSFDIFILPKNKFQKQASEVTGLTLEDGCLYKNKKQVPTVYSKDAVTSFINWLSERKSKCLLYAHNGRRFDVPRLLDLLEKHELLDDFSKYVYGFVDTIDIFKTLHPNKDKYTQPYLAKELLGLEYCAHDCVEDVLALAKLITHKSISASVILNHIDNASLDTKLAEKLNREIPTRSQPSLLPINAPQITEETRLAEKLNKEIPSKSQPSLLPINATQTTEETFRQEPKKHQGHWSLGLLTSMNDPDLLIEKDEKIVIIKDKYPKAHHHFLILPQENIPSFKAVGPSQLTLLKYMDSKASILASKYPESEFRFGYHAIPSMARLHLHVISQDFDSPCLKSKRHWNSFNTRYFLESGDVIRSLEDNGRCDTSEASKDLLEEQLKCHKCSYIPQNMPKLKDHLKKHL